MATEKLADAEMNDQQSHEAGDHNNEVVNDESSPKKAKLDEGGDSGKRRSRGGLNKLKPDDKVMAEAKAVYGELDLSEGRSLRRRSNPPKVEEQKKPTPRRNARVNKKQTDKEGGEGEKSAEESTQGTQEEKSLPAGDEDLTPKKESQNNQKEEESAEMKDKGQEEKAESLIEENSKAEETTSEGKPKTAE